MERVIAVNVKRIGEVYRQEGIKGIYDRILGRFYQRTNVYCRDISGPLPELGRNDLVHAEITPEMLAHMIREYGPEIPAEMQKKLAGRLEPGAKERAYAVMEHDGAILGYYCLSYRDIYDSNTDFYYPAREGNMYLFDGYTFIKHRNKGAQKFNTLAVLAVGKRQGLFTATVMVSDKNEYSKSSVLKSGFVECGMVHHVYLFSMKKSFARYIK